MKTERIIDDITSDIDKETLEFILGLVKRSSDYLTRLNDLKKEIRDITDSYMIANNLSTDEYKLLGGTIKLSTAEEIETAIFQQNSDMQYPRTAIEIHCNFVQAKIHINDHFFDFNKVKNQFSDKYQFKSMFKEHLLSYEISRNDIQNFLALLDKCR